MDVVTERSEPRPLQAGFVALTGKANELAHNSCVSLGAVERPD